MKTLKLIVVLLVFLCGNSAIANPDADKYIEVVRQFADNVLENCRDVYGEVHSPLFVDGMNVDTKQPIVWRLRDNEWMISNQANHQNLFRTLVGLTNLTGEAKYKDAAKEAISYMFDNHRASCGLLYWGGHQFIDLKTMKNIGEFDANCHEFKWNFPYYELMWEVDPKATEQFITALWNAHILDWDKLEMNRHGPYGRNVGNVWDDRNFEFPEPFFEARGLTFINAGSDLIYAAYRLHQLSNNEGAKTWGRRLLKLYVNARHPETKLGVYQYSQPLRRDDPPKDPNAPNFTTSWFGDRAQRQFGPEFGEIALEGNYLPTEGGIYSRHALSVLMVAEQLGEEGKELIDWMAEGMSAYAKYAYMPETNQTRPIWTDGTDITGFEFQRPGYYGREGVILRPQTADSILLHSYALCYRLAGDEAIWDMARGIAKGRGLGDLGEKPGESVNVNLETANSDPSAIFALADLYQAVKHPDYLKLACKIGDNIIEQRFHHGFFLPSENHINASVDALEPLALLTLSAVIEGKPTTVSRYNGNFPFIHGRYSGYGRVFERAHFVTETSSRAIYSKKREK